jgi:hypothetical protein
MDDWHFKRELWEADIDRLLFGPLEAFWRR